MMAQVRESVIQEWREMAPFERRLCVLCLPSLIFILLMAISLLLGFEWGAALLPATLWSQTIWSLGVTLWTARRDSKGRRPPYCD